MTKADIVKIIAQRSGVDKSYTQIIVEKFMETVKDSLAHGNEVYLRGFGTFEIIERAEKPGRNISQKTSLIIPAHNIPKFKPCKEFKDSVK